jgi:hypothetical protein
MEAVISNPSFVMILPFRQSKMSLSVRWTRKNFPGLLGFIGVAENQ